MWIQRRWRAVPGVRHVQAYAQRPAILETGEEVEGVVVKGLGADADPDFLARPCALDGCRIGHPGELSMELLVSGIHARELGLEPDQRVRLLLADARGELRPRVFTVVGVYETGLQEFDGEFVFCALHHLQELSGWGIKARIRVSDAVVDDTVVDGTGCAPSPCRSDGRPRAAALCTGRGVDWRGAGPHPLVGQRRGPCGGV